MPTATGVLIKPWQTIYLSRANRNLLDRQSARRPIQRRKYPGMNNPANPTAASSSLKEQMLNVPNRISAARLVLSVVLFFLIPLKLFWAAVVVFVVAAGSDWIDGWYARKYNLVTKLGRVLDPFCDKILICGAYILIAVEMTLSGGFPWYAMIAGWMAVVVVGRELLVTVLRSMIEGAGGDFSAKMAGKLKMVFQCVAVVACLIGLALKHAEPAAELPGWLFWAIVSSVWLSVISTLHSGVLYIFGAAEFIAQPDKN